jgi:hypothetical protein
MKLLSLLVVLACLANPASAGEIVSAYTDLDLDRCKATSRSEEEGGWYEGICPGHAGIPVYFAEGDLRQFVAFGKDGRKSCAAVQTFGHFNYAAGGKIEWRIEDGKPFATILRWHESSEEVKRQWLVVTKLGGDQCHTAYIDGRYPNANAIAREKADKSARTFNCKTDAIEVVAEPKVSAGEVAMGGHCPAENLRQ